MILAIVLISSMTLGALLLIARPLLASAAPAPDVAQMAAHELEDALERSLDSIEEIAFDHGTGHLSEADYSELDREERARAIELLRRKDRLSPKE